MIAQVVNASWEFTHLLEFLILERINRLDFFLRNTHSSKVWSGIKQKKTSLTGIRIDKISGLLFTL